MASGIDWTKEEAVARLRALWAEGHSTAEIGWRMGTSKNAIVGKAHRLGLPPRPSPIRGKGTGTPRRPTPRPRGPALPPLAGAASAAPARPPSAAPRPAALAAPAPEPAQPPATVFKPLAARHPCCWPIGEPGTREFRTCDGPAVPGKPYCQEHAALAYVPRTARGRPDGRVLDRYLKRELTRTA